MFKLIKRDLKSRCNRSSDRCFLLYWCISEWNRL